MQKKNTCAVFYEELYNLFFVVCVFGRKGIIYMFVVYRKQRRKVEIVGLKLFAIFKVGRIV